jgi:CubicO group peptidase (beta-lactamase class C family)
MIRCALLLAALVSFSGWQTAATASDAELLALIKTRVDAGRNTGIVVGVLRGDATPVIASYGNPGPGAKPLDADSVFEIGSITKVFTATLLLDMADRGLVKLDDPIGKYLPSRVRVPSRNGRQITLVDLATHTSGLPRLMTNLIPTDPGNPYGSYTVDQLYAFLSNYELARDIGAQYEYSNVGMGLLGHVLALRAGKDYEEVVAERILRPLGMTHTAITMTPWMKQHLAVGHNMAGAPVPSWDVRTIAGAGALRSTLTDMLTFARANLNPNAGKLQALMQDGHRARHPTGRAGLSVGLAWHIRDENGQTIVWHNGGTGGYRTWMGFDAKRGIAAVVLTNSTHGADDLGLTLLTPNAQPPRRWELVLGVGRPFGRWALGVGS